MSIHEKIYFAGVQIWSRKYTENTVKAWSGHHIAIKPPDTIIYSHKGSDLVLKETEVNQHDIGHYMGLLSAKYEFQRESVEHHHQPRGKSKLSHTLYEFLTGPRHAH